MPTVHLTQRNLSAMRAPHPDGRRTIYWSDELRGFGVACSGKTNQRIYIAQRDVNGKARDDRRGRRDHARNRAGEG